MAKVELKQPIVAEISDLLNGAASAVAVDYRGLTVAQDTELRKQLREAGVTYKVYKNTLIRRAGKEPILLRWILIWRGRQRLRYLKKMLQLLLVFWLSLPRRLISWRLRQVLWKERIMMQRGCRQFPAFRPERFCWADCLAA